MSIKTGIKKIIQNFPGWRSNRKIVVIESDDWGSIRMPSREVYEKILKAGYPVDKSPFDKFDSLASEEDLDFLFDLLSSVKDKNGCHPIITANCVVANPDFEKIKSDNYKNYHFELITDTFQQYPKCSNNFEKWIDAKNAGLFYPQFHAREHLNVSKYMNALQAGDKDVLFAFENKIGGSITKSLKRSPNYFVEATHYSSEIDKKDKLDIYLEGLDIFQKMFGYKSQSIIPTNYIWSDDFNQSVANKDVKYIQGSIKLKEPINDKMKYHKRILGRINNVGQINLVRNCYFEPTLFNKIDSVINCLREIEIAFLMKKPAIIGCHRLNFVGTVFAENRDKNLKLFSILLNSIIKKWPDVEFMTSVELGDLIAAEKK